MKILVCISNVPDTTSKINFNENDTLFDTQGVQYVINPNDEFGLTRAIWFKEQQGATVDVLHVGKSDAEPTLRKALAIGADKAIRVDSEPTDGFFVASQIAAYVQEKNYDLIVAGRESIDYNGGMVPGMLASMLDYSFVNTCVGLEINGQEAVAIREMDGGSETLSTKLPLVIGAQKGLVEETDLKIPNMRGIMQARQKPFEVVASQPISAKTTVTKFEKPAPKAEVKLIPADDIDQLIHLLQNEAKVL
ncbi:MAG: electron transfer flavoprotein subunit beta/FixA family protein [Flavobacteriaceae bacterium]